MLVQRRFRQYVPGDKIRLAYVKLFIKIDIYIRDSVKNDMLRLRSPLPNDVPLMLLYIRVRLSSDAQEVSQESLN